MKNVAKFLLLLLSINVFAQKNISNVRIKQAGSNLEIRYDCNGIEKGDSLKLIIKSKDSGITYEPKSLSGMVGLNISSGKNKLIIWNIAEDNIVINEAIKAELILSYFVPPPVPKSTNTKIFSALLSIPLPGLGSYMVAPKKRPLLRIATGLSVYGSMAAALYARQMSDDYYLKYSRIIRESEAQPYYDKANLYHKASYVGLGISVTIWAVELTNAIIKSRQSESISQKGGFSFKSNIVFNTPVMGINYTF